MAKNFCCVCGKPLGLFSDKISLKDGVLCTSCMKHGGFSSIDSSNNLYADGVSKIIKKKTSAVCSFSPDRDDGIIQIDTRNCLFKIEDNYFFFDEVISYKYNEFPCGHTAQGADRRASGAAIGGIIGGIGGGLVGGSIGAAVGGKIGSLFSAACEYMNISLILNNPIKPNYRINFISSKVNTSSQEYKRAYRKANECLETLKIIEQYNIQSRQARATHKPDVKRVCEDKTLFIQEGHFTATKIEEELTVYRRMLASDVITEEEYEQKKKQLLSLK